MVPFRILGRILCELTGSYRILENPVGSCIGFLPGFLYLIGIIHAVDEAFTCLDVPDWRKKMTGFGAEKASVNLGSNAGVSAKLKVDVPHMVEIHCFPHRLELALLTMQWDCELERKVYDVLHLVWKTYHYSPKSKRELKALGTELGIDVSQPSQVKGSRWLPHVSRALEVLIKPVKDGDMGTDESQYAAVLQHMEHLASTSAKTEIKGRATNVARTMKDESIVAFCHFVADMFQILSKMSLHFQWNDLVLPSAPTVLKEATGSIKMLPKHPVPGGKMEAILESLKKQQHDPPHFQGITLNKATGRRALTSLSSGPVQKNVEQAVELCLKGMKERFGPLFQIKTSATSANVDQIISDFLVFNNDAWPSNMQDLVDFGQDKIDRLINWFQVSLASSGRILSAVLCLPNSRTNRTMTFKPRFLQKLPTRMT